MTVPGWWAFLLIGLGVFRICRLVGWDDLTIPWRQRLTGLGDMEHSQWAHIVETFQQYDRDVFAEPRPTIGDWFTIGMKQIPPLVSHSGIVGAPGASSDEPDKWAFVVPISKRRWYLSKMIRCPWCFGWWCALAVWIAYQAAPQGTLIVMSLFAVSAVPGLVTKNLDK